MREPMQKGRFFWPLLFLATLGCNNRRDTPAETDDAGAVFADYQISGEEGQPTATLLLQYRMGGPTGEGLRLPGGVQVDGTPLSADSARQTGVYYEASLPLDSTGTTHQIVFTDADNRRHTDTFRMEPFRLKQDLPQRLPRQPFALQLAGLPAAATVRLVMVDTAYDSPDVNEERRLENGRLIVSAPLLANLQNGPVLLEIHREAERPVADRGKGGGRLLWSYTLRRQFELTDR